METQRQGGQQSTMQARLFARPGAEFLERRWRRAAQVPASERSPDVAAFVEAYQLLQEAHAMLPIDRNERATLPETPAAQQQVLSALVRMARSDCLSPMTLDTLAASIMPAVAYSSIVVRWAAPEAAQTAAAGDGSGSRCGDTALLADVLSGWLFVGFMLGQNMPILQPADVVEAVRGCCYTAERLSDPSNQAAVQRALAQLAAADGQQQAQVTAEQLQYAVSMAVTRFVPSALGLATRLGSVAGSQPPSSSASASARPYFSEQQRLELLAARERASALMLQLQPSNPQAWLEAGITGDIVTPNARNLERCARALELARQQQRFISLSPAATKTMSYFASLHYNGPVPASSAAAARSALAALDSLPAELERSRRLLPETWVRLLEAASQFASPEAAAVRAILSGSVVAPLPAFQRMADVVERASTVCAGCWKSALDLRACSRCRTTKYCR
jgi:hypothetical protein